MPSFLPDVLNLPNAPEQDPMFTPHLYYDWLAVLQIGIASAVGVIWWVVSWLVYIKTDGNDPDLQHAT